MHNICVTYAAIPLKTIKEFTFLSPTHCTFPSWETWRQHNKGINVCLLADSMMYKNKYLSSTRKIFIPFNTKIALPADSVLPSAVLRPAHSSTEVLSILVTAVLLTYAHPKHNTMRTLCSTLLVSTANVKHQWQWEVLNRCICSTKNTMSTPDSQNHVSIK
jgi:uncharacterized membrane protein